MAVNDIWRPTHTRATPQATWSFMLALLRKLDLVYFSFFMPLVKPVLSCESILASFTSNEPQNN